MAPIIGRAHIGYLPTDKVVGISKLARVVDAYSRRFQVQKPLAQIAHCIENVLKPVWAWSSMSTNVRPRAACTSAGFP